REHVLQAGAQTVAWVIEETLKPDKRGAFCLAAISPDYETAHDQEFMADLIGRIGRLQGLAAGDGADRDVALVSALVADAESFRWMRAPLPDGFTAGKTVYLAHLFIDFQHLPPDLRFLAPVPCAVVWADAELPIYPRALTQVGEAGLVGRAESSK